MDILGEIECWSKEEDQVSVLWYIQKLILYMQKISAADWMRAHQYNLIPNSAERWNWMKKDETAVWKVEIKMAEHSFQVPMPNSP